MRREGWRCGNPHVRAGPARHAPPVPSFPAAPQPPMDRCLRPPSRSPPIRSGCMTRFVIDAPTLVHLVAERIPVAPGHTLVAPQLLRSQALALLFDAVRGGRLTEAQALARHDELTRVKVRL